ncbi:MAG: bifunctional phosphopantothenoylcysteine decarboxylase/phosphopantothenate--cysteine ligase CoaBC [Sumerlaeia bacterium]
MKPSDLRLLLGVSSSIAAYRALDLASLIVKEGGQVRVVLTPNTVNLVSAAAFEAITGRPAIVSLWGSGHEGQMDHLGATKWANAFAVAPATAATIGRLAHGLADDALSTFAVAWPGALVIAPAMNPAMYGNPAVQENLRTLSDRGHVLIEPGEGRLACGDIGPGRLAPVESILETILNQASPTSSPLAGRRILITSGPTREFADPARCITNPSTGKMGVALAREAHRLKARVTLVSGPSDLPLPDGLRKVVRVTTAEEMRDAVLANMEEAEILIFAAAVCDWKPATSSMTKAKKEGAEPEMALRLVRTPDVAMAANEARRPGQYFVGFAAESHDLVKHAREKMERKGFDFVVANPINEEGSGFGSETNRAVLVDARNEEDVPMTTKGELAAVILRRVAAALSVAATGQG